MYRRRDASVMLVLRSLSKSPARSNKLDHDFISPR
jgi:hypothetical protein